MAGRINEYRFSHRFKKQYKNLPLEIREAFKEKLELFLTNMQHPSLRVKKIQGVENRWEGSVTMKYRFTFQFDKDTAVSSCLLSVTNYQESNNHHQITDNRFVKGLELECGSLTFAKKHKHGFCTPMRYGNLLSEFFFYTL